MFKSLIVLASFIAAVKAGCDNACSGHGCCGERGICECFDNWGLGLSHLSGDCSERICPFELAWVDNPDSTGNHHRYAECSNRGICNRQSGECECFPGYEGKGCQRTSCPNDCSGHGRCKFIQNLPFGAVAADYLTQNPSPNMFYPQEAYQFTYYGWDNQKTRGCECDPEWGDVDCSKRMCQFGTDIMDQRDDMLLPQKYQVQRLVFQANEHDDALFPIREKTFALTFKSKLNETFTTLPINFYSATGAAGGTDGLHEFILDIEEGLEKLPNKVIDNVEVHGHLDATNRLHVNITFVGDNVQGPQNLITVKSILCGDGCTPKLSGLELAYQPESQNVTQITRADFNSYECGRRGKCDYTTGLCQCFAGYTGLSCSTIACLV